ncbi:MAG: T9SS type A sorting domain-containing protein [Algoriphagus sp.]|nr:T9SS type A sorting domain-containing protein [Algoriphagus sp.]
MNKYLVLFFVFLWAGPIQASKKFASPNGSPDNSGISADQAWSLAFALGNSSPLVPGDSLVLTDGIFEGNFTSTINGTAEKPIIILAQNEGKSIIDVGKQRTTGTGLIINGSHTWFVGIHVTSSSLIRKSDASNSFATIAYESGISVFGDNNKIINCWIYDVVGGGLELWRSGLNLEVYGSVIFNNGSQDVTRGTGHGMYVQHDQPAQPKVIENNFVFQNASQGINIFTTNPENRGVVVKRNVSFNTGVIATFDPFLFRPPHNLSIGSQNNVSSEMEVTSNFFYSDLQGGRLSTNDVSNVTLGRTFTPNRDILFNDNILFGGRNQVELQPLEGLSFQRNKLLNVHGNFFAFLGNSSSFPNSTWDSNIYSNIANLPKPFQGLTFPEWKSEYYPFDINSTYSTNPSSLREVLITQNKYDPYRFHVSILSFNDSEIIELDFSDFPEFKDRNYEIRDLQNPFDPTQKAVGSFGGTSISFPMNWTKSLQPKGNMPFQPVHTDLTFGTFLLVFEKGEVVSVVFPEVKDSVALFLNEDGRAFLTSQDFLTEPPSESFTYTSSEGFEFSCSNLGSTPISITLKNTRTGEEKIDQTVVWVFDTIPPYFDAANATYLFDPVVGKVSISIADFDIVDFKDNCATNWNISQSRFEVTCADIYQNPEAPVWEFPVVLTSTDPSGNSYSRTVKVIIGNVIESKKVSITSLDPLTDDGTSTLKLGNELEYEVLGWTRNGQLIPGQTGKEISVNSPGQYQAGIQLSTGCAVTSKSFNFESPDLPAEYTNDVNLILDDTGKVALTPLDIFGTNEKVADEVILGQTNFDCTDLGTQKVKVTLNTLLGNDSYTNEFWINVIVKDNLAPVLTTKIPSLAFDLVKGVLELNPEDFVASLTDNCSVADLYLNKTRITCADYDLPIELILTATDQSGNSTSELFTVFASSFESQKISINPSGNFQAYKGEPVEIKLGDEFGFSLESWLKDGVPIVGEKGKAILVNEPGTYWARILPDGGCSVLTEKVTVTFSDLPYGVIKELIELPLDESGKASLKPENVFVNWPLADPNLDIKLSQSEFTCPDIGEKQIIITIKNQAGQIWEEKTIVKVQDNLKPVLIPKNFNADFDVTVGSLALKPADFIAELTDNCGVKEVTINKTSANCEDLGKEIPVAIRAVDASGNVVEAVAILTLNRIETKKVILSGDSKFCEGEKGLLTLTSEAQFEVIRWRRDGVEIEGQKGKTLEIGQGGKYHAVIRYQGGCLSETNEFVVEVNPLPKGEIEVKGNVLTAPVGSFKYQWFRNGELISGATSRELTVHQMGEFTVELTSEAGCKAKLKSVEMTISGLGNNWVVEPEELKVYPNPASRNVEVEIISDQNSSFGSIRVYGMDGKDVSSSVKINRSGSSSFTLDISQLSNGTYMIVLEGDKQKVFIGRFIKNE